MTKAPELVREHELFRWGYQEGMQVGAAAGFVARMNALDFEDRPQDWHFVKIGADGLRDYS